MLRSLRLKDVGPAARLELELGERLNVLTGDNGLGKSFMLDVAWWALTRTWIDRPVLPQPGKEESARIVAESECPVPQWYLQGAWEQTAGTYKQGLDSGFNRVVQQWQDEPRPDSSGWIIHPSSTLAVPSWIAFSVPVLYIRTNGSFSLWDPARSHTLLPDHTKPRIISAAPYHFSERALWWDGLEHDGKKVCNGLLQDWVTWQLEAADSDETHPFHLLCRVLDRLSHPEEKMRPGKPVQPYIDDVRKIPTIELPYETLPIVHASSGMKRILGLSYLIAWAWTEHVRASRLIGWSPSSQMVMLMEEPETHLHAKWQRHIVPALLDVLTHLAPGMRPQVLLTTHAPLVLASIEPHFLASKDKLFLFELRDREVTLRELPWAKRGDAIGWLTSPVFGLEQARSIEAERAIEAAEALMRGEVDALPEGLRTEEEIHRELLHVLPDQDRFWPRWIVRRERGGA
ncbi:MAG: AAA family ATPase [Polyangiaceae bacterium]|nr:AAA family ATPase [Polyangiaceae bacterium]